ncbi:MAG TPA: hypothetical protein VF132_09095, partial [Rudaea sp.]
MKRALVLGIALALAAGTSNAMMINPRGTGQVLVFPYYTVNAGQATLFSVINTTARGKALKVRFHEAYNGRNVLDMNVYLSAYDVWTGAISERSDDDGAALVSNDNSCTVPAFQRVPLTPPGSGFQTVPIAFSAANYSGLRADTGPSGPARAREGHFDVIEMGELTNATSQQSLKAITHVNGVPPGCDQMVEAWAQDGYWTAKSTVDMAAPTGGLYGEESIINVPEGTMYGLNAIAIDRFSTIAQNTSPDDPFPDLNTAIDSGTGQTTSVTVEVPVNGHMTTATFTNPVDAMSALFMVDSLENEYVLSSSIGATSDWVVTVPTKRFYVDKLLQPANPGVSSLFDASFGDIPQYPGTSCASGVPNLYNREEQTSVGTSPAALVALCYETNVLTFDGAPSALGSHLTTAFDATHTSIIASNGLSAGQLRIDFDPKTAASFKRH